VDLYPGASSYSVAWGVGGGQQVGAATVGGVSHASLWSGTGASWVDLHPAASTYQSEALGVHGGQQVGQAYVGDVQHASLWSGSAASWLDLHAFLPAGFSSSVASEISHDAGVTYVVGWGYNDTTGTYEALMWVYEPLVTCASIEIHAARHTVGSGSNPGSTKDPLVGITVGVYDASNGSCARQQDQQGDGISWQEYPAIVANCTPVQSGVTDGNGVATIAVPNGDYVVISHFDSDGNGSLDQYIGVSAGGVQCGQTTTKHLQLLVDAQGNKKPGKTTRLTGSELLIIEPEYVIWDNTVQLYPFVFETIGDWSVTTSVTPPEGFVADYPQLSANVDNELAAVQFTITEIGSDPSPTQTRFDILHNGQPRTVDSKVDIRLTPAYAASRGFDVTYLRAKGLIVDRSESSLRNAKRAGSARGAP
jgi:hypothetical protein